MKNVRSTWLRAVAWIIPCFLWANTLISAPFSVLGNNTWGGGYVANLEDTTNPLVYVNLPEFSQANCVCVSPDGGLAYFGVRQGDYVGNFFGNYFFVYDLVSKTITDTVPVSMVPSGVATSPDGKIVYVCGYHETSANGSLQIFERDSSGNLVLETSLSLGNFSTSIAVTPDGTKAYVSNYNDNSVSVIDLVHNTVAATLVNGSGYSFQNPYDVAITPDGTKVYVTDDNIVGTKSGVDCGGVTVLWVADNTQKTVILFLDGEGETATPFFGENIAISPDGSKAFVTASSQSVTLISATQVAVIDIQNDVLGPQPFIYFTDNDAEAYALFDVAVTPDSSRLYVAMAGDNLGAWVGVANSSSTLEPTYYSAPFGNNVLAITGIPGPRNVVGKVKTDHAKRFLKIKWDESLASDVSYYEIYNLNRKVARVSAKTHKKVIRLRGAELNFTTSQLETYFKVRAVNKSKNISSFVQVSIAG